MSADTLTPADPSVAEAYRLPVDQIAQRLETDPEKGLTAEVARQRLEQYGPNELEHEPPVPGWKRFLAQFNDVLVILLLIATAISVAVWLYEGEEALPYEALVIFSIVLLNGILGYVQEARAEEAVSALQAMSAAEAQVIRDGKRQSVKSTELVPGDVLLLEEGDTIGADGRLVQATGLQTAEAPLTGESVPVSKTADPIEAEAGVGDQTNMAFSGTAVTYGRGKALVTATGMKTEMGKIAGMLQRAEANDTPLQKELDKTGKRLGLIVIVIAVIMVGTILLVEGATDFSAVMEVLILGVALAVAAVPEGLPAIVTAVLAIGVRRMADRNAIVRKLPAVETLGSATVIASDKTGTLTKNEMTVRAVITASGRTNLTGTGYQPEGAVEHQTDRDESALTAETERILRAADLANNAVLQEKDGQWIIQGDPTEGALLVAARKAGMKPDELESRFRRVGEVPFSSERKLMSTVHTDAEKKEERNIVFTKGAPDVLLERCTHELVGEEARALTDERRMEIKQANEQLAEEALRTLGVAFRSVAPDTQGDKVDDAVEQELVFLGLVGMIDPPRPEAKEAVTKAHKAGIRTMMITGDHPKTAAAIAKELGMVEEEKAVVGGELQKMDEATLERTVQEVSVYARVNPEHKLKIVEALKRNGQVVAMTGDGVNDAPALKTADIGVAMGITGTDVSKEAADMVLTDDNFASIVAAVEEGRSIFANIQKFLRYLLSSNIGEVLTMFLGVVLEGVIGLTSEEGLVVLPLLATQILWINLMTDGAPALALGLDPDDPEVMNRPPRDPNEGVITGSMWRGIVLVGVVMAVGTLLVLDASLPGGLIEGDGKLAYGRTMAFTTLVMFQLFNTFNARSDTQTAFHRPFQNPWLLGAIGLSLVLHVLVIYLPWLQTAFETVPLSLGDWLECVLVGASVVVVREVSKLMGW
ncbi:Ca2+-transporting ATPase [Catalinimonas alkaloidigena]|uniref:Ca2+-transporting ATPase n=1 Tax=Catalinimonas alkaloidigena TaxID=1075417 RepID=A0A1G9DGT9_9BACT|nr:cation-translocating P-type ATPase [Catalinimonas alkaloidigena]SDK63076.1 Ca2+-transporting ATPase [Catalinimonas alkaloidigena]